MKNKDEAIIRDCFDIYIYLFISRLIGKKIKDRKKQLILQ